jgi:hypothetical protein
VMWACEWHACTPAGSLCFAAGALPVWPAVLIAADSPHRRGHNSKSLTWMPHCAASQGVLYLDDFTFDKVCACSYAPFAGWRLGTRETFRGRMSCLHHS